MDVLGGAVRKAITFGNGRLPVMLMLSLQMLPALAQDQQGQAMDAALADGVTTAVGVAASGGVINPVGPLLATAMKAVTLHRASALPEAEQPAAYAAASAMWRGGTASNVCITAVFLTGGGFAPACLALGAAFGMKSWNDSEHERHFWERCAIVRQFAKEQTVRCVYGPLAPQAGASEPAPRQPLARKTRGTQPATRQELLLHSFAPAPAPAPTRATPVSYEVEAP